MPKRNDIKGQRFGRLLVVGLGEKNNRGELKWECLCDCGNTKHVMYSHLTSGDVQSCGCYHKEKVKEANKRFNTYDITGKYGIGYTLKEEPFFFDLEDYDKIKDYCWHKSNKGYIVSKGNKIILLHRLILDLKSFNYDNMGDHINGNRVDDRKENLRIVNATQNNINRMIQPTNTSGATGVLWDKSRNKWVARIKIYNKNIYLGRFDNFEDALSVRKIAEVKYFGEYSFDSSRATNV